MGRLHPRVEPPVSARWTDRSTSGGRLDGMTGCGGQWSGSASTREDVTLAAAVGVAGLLEVLAGMAEQRLIASVCVVGMAVALAFRRWQPPLVLLAVLALFLVQSAAGVSVQAQL